MNVRTICVAVSFAFAAPVWAHEFWVQPLADMTRGMGGLGKEMKADIRRGENFVGDALVYNPANFQRFEVHTPRGVRPVEGRLGDKPALSMVTESEGMHVVVYVSDVQRTTYLSFDQFESFAAYEGLDGAAERHRARGLPEDGVFSEAYTRYAKALVPVNHAKGGDRRIGLPIEIVLDEVGTLEPSGTVYLDGSPMANAQVRVFTQFSFGADRPVSTRTVRTDAQGRFAISVGPIERVMLNVVHLREPDATLAKSRNVVWETRWASLVFTAPQ